MAINPIDLKVFNKKEFDFRFNKEYKIISYIFLISGSALIITGFFTETSFSQYTFTIYEGCSGSLASVGFVAIFCIQRRPPTALYSRKLFDLNHPLSSVQAQEIVTSIYSEFTQKKKSKCEFYSLCSSEIYFDYVHGGITVTSSLAHLIDSVSWRNLKLPPSKDAISYIHSYTDLCGYSHINGSLRSGHISFLAQKFFPNYGTKRFLYRIICISNYLALNRSEYKSKLFKGKSPTLFRGTSPPLEYIHKTHKLGAIIRDRAFWSTSSETGFKGKVQYTIKKHSSAMPISHLSAIPIEQEWLFPPNTKFKITQIKKIFNEEYKVELEEV